MQSFSLTNKQVSTFKRIRGCGEFKPFCREGTNSTFTIQNLLNVEILTLQYQETVQWENYEEEIVEKEEELLNKYIIFEFYYWFIMKEE